MVEAFFCQSLARYDSKREHFDPDTDLIFDVVGDLDAVVSFARRFALGSLQSALKEALTKAHPDWGEGDIQKFKPETQVWLAECVFPSLGAVKQTAAEPKPKRRRLGLQ